MGRLAAAVLLMLLSAACGDRVRYVTASGAGAAAPSLVARGDSLAVAWHDRRDGNGEIYMRLLDRDGQPAGPERRLTSDAPESYDPSLVAVGDAAFALAWHDAAGNATRAHLGLWTQDGQRRWTTTVTTRGRHPIVRVRDRDLFVAWIEDESATSSTIWAQWWSSEGKPLDQPTRLAPASRTTTRLEAGIDRYGRAWVVFDAIVGTRADEIFLVRAGGMPARLTDDDGKPSRNPDVVVARTRVAIAWHDERDGNSEIYLSVVTPEEIDRFNARAKRITYSAGASVAPCLAWNGPVLGLAWSDDTEGQAEIYFQFLDANGRDLTVAERQTETGRASQAPSIVPWGESFAMAWSESEAAAGSPPSTAASEIAFNVVD